MLSNCNDIYCHPAGFSSEEYSVQTQQQTSKIIYVADPMCSWCYGMHSELEKLKEYFKFKQPKLKFTTTVGGLRPGGGDEWDTNFKLALQHHWKEVEKKSGKVFSYKIFEKEDFNFDTEPACRAIVAARQLKPQAELDFIQEIQNQFFQESKDPTDISFYKSICIKNGINYLDFTRLFLDEDVKELTRKEFMINREWGVTAFPTIIFQQEDNLFAVARGYTSFEALKNQIEKIQNKVVN